MVEKSRCVDALLNFSLRWFQPNQVLRLFLKLFLVTPKVYNYCEYIAYFWIRKLKYFIVRLFVVVVIGCLFYSCGDVKEGKQVEMILEDTLVEKALIIKDSVVQTVVSPDTIFLLSKVWKSVYYIKNNDTIHSDTPFFLELLSDSNKFIYALNGKFSDNQKWSFKNTLFETSGEKNDCYKIISISDSVLRTRDTSKLGYEYLFGIK